jgi:hypothetical protein
MNTDDALPVSLEKKVDQVCTRFREHVRKVSTESLLDRVTVYRGEMEIAALEIIELELAARGVGSARVDAHAAQREQDGIVRHADGIVVRCNFCERPATEHLWKWHRLWGWFLPLFPRFCHLCKEHHEQLPTDAHGRTMHHAADEYKDDEGPVV